MAAAVSAMPVVASSAAPPDGEAPPAVMTPTTPASQAGAPMEAGERPSGGGGKRKEWTQEEDDLLQRLVSTYGPKRWSVIASHLDGRVGKQCRERWHNHLRTDITKSIWTEHEEQVINDAVKKYGKKWATIARMLPGRTENAIKNHWNSAIRKADRSEARKQRELVRQADMNQAALNSAAVCGAVAGAPPGRAAECAGTNGAASSAVGVAGPSSGPPPPGMHIGVHDPLKAELRKRLLSKLANEGAHATASSLGVPVSAPPSAARPSAGAGCALGAPTAEGAPEQQAASQMPRPSEPFGVPLPPVCAVPLIDADARDGAGRFGLSSMYLQVLGHSNVSTPTDANAVHMADAFMQVQNNLAVTPLVSTPLSLQPPNAFGGAAVDAAISQLDGGREAAAASPDAAGASAVNQLFAGADGAGPAEDGADAPFIGDALGPDATGRDA